MRNEKKTKFALIAIIFGLLTIFSTNMKAECPTPMDCPDDPFIGPFYRNIALSETCTLRYEYCWRNAHCYEPYITYHDLFIGSMQLIGDCTWFQQDILNNLKTYVGYCADDVTLNVNPWNASPIPECCPPSSEPCWTDWIWRHGSYACYTDWYWDPITQYWTIDNCEVENPHSCWDKCRYCFTLEYQTHGDPLKKYTKECQNWINNQGCPEFGGINGDLPCHAVCE